MLPLGTTRRPSPNDQHIAEKWSKNATETTIELGENKAGEKERESIKLHINRYINNIYTHTYAKL